MFTDDTMICTIDLNFLVEWLNDTEAKFDVVGAKKVQTATDKCQSDILEVQVGDTARAEYQGTWFDVKIIAKGLKHK